MISKIDIGSENGIVKDLVSCPKKRNREYADNTQQSQFMILDFSLLPES